MFKEFISFVDLFEKKILEYTGSKNPIATVNGMAALHIAQILAGVKQYEEVITQPLTFAANVNSITNVGAKPIFIDVNGDTLGNLPKSFNNSLKPQTLQGTTRKGIKKKQLT